MTHIVLRLSSHHQGIASPPSSPPLGNTLERSLIVNRLNSHPDIQGESGNMWPIERVGDMQGGDMQGHSMQFRMGLSLAGPPPSPHTGACAIPLGAECCRLL